VDGSRVAAIRQQTRWRRHANLLCLRVAESDCRKTLEARCLLHGAASPQQAVGIGRYAVATITIPMGHSPTHARVSTRPHTIATHQLVHLGTLPPSLAKLLYQASTVANSPTHAVHFKPADTDIYPYTRGLLPSTLLCVSLHPLGVTAGTQLQFRRQQTSAAQASISQAPAGGSLSGAGWRLPPRRRRASPSQTSAGVSLSPRRRRASPRRRRAAPS